MKDTYTKAILDLLAKDLPVATITAGFSQVLQTRGHERLALPVWRSVLRALQSGSSTETTVYVSKATDAVTHQTAIEALLKTLTGTDTKDFTTKVDDTLIGGFVIEANKQRIDSSYKSKLIALYRQVTT